MLRIIPESLCWALVPLVAVLLLGCGGGGGSAPTGSGTGTGSNATQTAILHPYGDTTAMGQRWLDIADYLYSAAFPGSFQYPDNAVTVTYTPSHSIPQFTVTAPAHALKPNFCYQMKLVGPLATLTSSDPHTLGATNYALGSSGRWWSETAQWNVADADMASHVNDQMNGYLYFEFFVTAADGSVNFTSGTTNSFHVTWKSSQITDHPHGANDGPVRQFTVTPAVGWAYDAAQTAAQVGLFGEWEPTRTLPGHMALPVGSYSGVEFRLTEESYHSTDATNGGRWWTAMASDPLSFDVTQ